MQFIEPTSAKFAQLAVSGVNHIPYKDMPEHAREEMKLLASVAFEMGVEIGKFISPISDLCAVVSEQDDPEYFIAVHRDEADENTIVLSITDDTGAYATDLIEVASYENGAWSVIEDWSDKLESVIDSLDPEDESQNAALISLKTVFDL